jgi:RNA polymerase sigma-70 factor (ECF subfamily)
MPSPFLTTSPSALVGASDAPAALDLEALYRQHAEAVWRWAGRLVGPASDLDLEDIVQEVFLVVQRRLADFRGEAKITTWLYEITMRVVRDRRRRRRWRHWVAGPGDRRPGHGAGDLAQVQADQPGALELLERREATQQLYRILDGVGEKYREVIIMFELEGMSGQAIAAVTGLSLSNVWVRLFRGRQKVLERFLDWERRGTP